ncbi:hypothetical protein E2C01_079201 [Portunus trituberculatus]|uniref:Uncharacterized protein n=1 Tax=Portunus trituberculatus TaxID=210409 RepID=A0A5B7IQ00_PORTR|nr:hypothetical protein [Portunus trituberculatus]
MHLQKLTSGIEIVKTGDSSSYLYRPFLMSIKWSNRTQIS